VTVVDGASTDDGVDEPAQSVAAPEVKATPQPVSKIKSVLDAWGDE
jgi:hypothetical protein